MKPWGDNAQNMRPERAQRDQPQAPSSSSWAEFGGAGDALQRINAIYDYATQYNDEAFFSFSRHIGNAMKNGKLAGLVIVLSQAQAKAKQKN